MGPGYPGQASLHAFLYPSMNNNAVFGGDCFICKDRLVVFAISGTRWVAPLQHL